MPQPRKSIFPVVLFSAIALCGAALIGGLFAARARPRHEGEAIHDRIRNEAAILGLSITGDEAVRPTPDGPSRITRLPPPPPEAPLTAPAKPGTPSDKDGLAREEAARTLDDVRSRTTAISGSGPLAAGAALRSAAGSLRDALAARTAGQQTTFSNPSCHRLGCVFTISTRDQAAFEASRAGLIGLVDASGRHRFGPGPAYVSSPLPMPDGALETTVILYGPPDGDVGRLLDRDAATPPSDRKPDGADKPPATER